MPEITSSNGVALSDEAQEHLFGLIHKGVNSARVITRARVLTKLAKGHSNPYHYTQVRPNLSLPIE